MTESGKRVLELAMLLSREERVEVAAKLVASVNAFAEAAAIWSDRIERRARRAIAEESAAQIRTVTRSGVCIDIEAEVDLELAVSWYEDNHPDKVDGFLTEVTDSLARIFESPGSYGRLSGVSPELDIQRIFLRDYPYCLAFLNLHGEIRVLAVAHTYRRPFERDISVGALVAVEQWLSANGVRALTVLAAAGLARQ